MTNAKPSKITLLESFALEPVINADKNFEWPDGKLVVAANNGPIPLIRAAYYVVRLEVQLR